MNTGGAFYFAPPVICVAADALKNTGGFTRLKTWCTHEGGAPGAIEKSLTRSAQFADSASGLLNYSLDGESVFLYPTPIMGMPATAVKL